HGSLKVFAHEYAHAVNGSMVFDQDTLSPTYRFKKGTPGSSYAFEIAQRMDLQPSLLDKARRLLGEGKRDMETLITELEAKTQEADRLKRDYDQLQSDTEKERHRYEEKQIGRASCREKEERKEGE